MPRPTIDFVGMTPSPALRIEIERHVLRLTHMAPQMTSCHVTLRRAEGHHRKGSRFHVHVRAMLPGGTFDVGGRSAGAHEHDDAYVAVRESFRALRRKIEEFQSLRRHHGHSHDSQDAASA
jgi:putative sigma-54 modulation protein